LSFVDSEHILVDIKQLLDGIYEYEYKGLIQELFSSHRIHKVV